MGWDVTTVTFTGVWAALHAIHCLAGLGAPAMPVMLCLDRVGVHA
jgi:hypothetical protein